MLRRQGHVKDLAKAVPEALLAGVAIVGSCGGSTPEHTRAIRMKVDEFLSAG
jgi:5-methyltetrahydrofolate--homocysteine methyltransferase